MKEAIKFVLVLAVTTLVIFIVRTYAITIYTVPNTIAQPALKAGDRVMVNKLARDSFHVGDLIVFCEGQNFIGQIKAIPGDTGKCYGNQYILPTRCCSRCRCEVCRNYLVVVGDMSTLVPYHKMVGKAYRLFNLELWK